VFPSTDVDLDGAHCPSFVPGPVGQCVLCITLAADLTRHVPSALALAAGGPYHCGMTTPNQPRLIGILGGMGPAATVDLQAKIIALTPAERDQDHVPVVVWNVPQIPERPSAILQGTASPLPAMLAGARALEAAGATAIAMPCNTAHHWAEDIQTKLRIPFLHIADAVLDSLPSHPGPIALLATRATIQSGFYQRRFAEHGVEARIPDDATLARLFDAIRLVKAGRVTDARDGFIAIARRELDQGANHLLLACTELPLLSPGTAIEAQCIDPTAALARACINHAFAEEPTLGAQLA